MTLQMPWMRCGRMAGHQLSGFRPIEWFAKWRAEQCFFRFVVQFAWRRLGLGHNWPGGQSDYSEQQRSGEPAVEHAILQNKRKLETESASGPPTKRRDYRQPRHVCQCESAARVS